jgi:hypothetical protein
MLFIRRIILVWIFGEMEYEDVKWIQLMQPGSVGNMVMNISVA